MSRVRAPVTALEAGERVLDEAPSHYLFRVLRRAAGARFVAFDPVRGVEADAEILADVGGRARVRLGEPRAAAVVATTALTWVHALSKGDKLDDIVRDATELGATKVVVTTCARSVVQLDGARATARRERWSKIAREAARQSGRADPPEIAGPLLWTAALTVVPADAARFCLHTGDAPPLGPTLLAALRERRSLAFAAGPEGGFTDAEIVAAADAGFVVASLGAFVLRTETVPAAVLGACRVLSSLSEG